MFEGFELVGPKEWPHSYAVGSWHSLQARLISQLAQIAENPKESAKKHVQAIELLDHGTFDVQHPIVYRDFANFLREIGLPSEAAKYYETIIEKIDREVIFHPLVRLLLTAKTFGMLMNFRASLHELMVVKDLRQCPTVMNL